MHCWKQVCSYFVIDSNMMPFCDHLSDIDQNSAGIMEEIEKSKESVFHKKKSLEEERDHFQKAAYTVLNMLNTRDSNE